jgi:hypothetical protein
MFGFERQASIHVQRNVRGQSGPSTTGSGMRVPVQARHGSVSCRAVDWLTRSKPDMVILTRAGGTTDPL